MCDKACRNTSTLQGPVPKTSNLARMYRIEPISNAPTQAIELDALLNKAATRQIRTPGIERPPRLSSKTFELHLRCESSDSYQRLLSLGYPAAIKVVGFDGAYKKFDELGPYRERHHPGVGIFFKGFQKNAFNQSVMEIKNFLTENLR
jgi:hypothetical protein